MAFTTFDFTSWQTYVGAVGMMILGIICASLGVGGGVLISPLLLVLGFETHFALPITKPFIFGGSLVTLFFNMWRRRPDGRPYINWPIFMLAEPSTIVTVFFGVLLNSVAPWSLINLLLIALLIFSSLNFYMKARKLHKAFDQEKTVNEPQSADGVAPISNDTSDIASPAVPASPASPLSAPAMPWPTAPSVLSICLLALVWVCNNGSAVTTAVAHLSSCSALSLGLTIGALCISAVAVCVIYFYDRYAKLIQHRLPLVGGGLAAGFLAAALGVGGGIVKTPVLLMAGLDPVAAAATSSAMIAFTSSSSSIQYLVKGAYGWADAGVAFALGVTSFAIGKLALSKFFEKKSYRITYALAGLVGLCVVVVTIRTGLDIPARGWGVWKKYC